MGHFCAVAILDTTPHASIVQQAIAVMRWWDMVMRVVQADKSVRERLAQDRYASISKDLVALSSGSATYSRACQRDPTRQEPVLHRHDSEQNWISRVAGQASRTYRYLCSLDQRKQSNHERNVIQSHRTLVPSANQILQYLV
jgi:hypothetical protein